MEEMQVATSTEESRDPFLPLRWESTGDQWWYATPIDWAAASGHYDVVRELLRLDPNLLVKLTSLRRIRRLESVWDDDARLRDAATNRAAVARRLLLDFGEPADKKHHQHHPRGGGGDADANRLLRAGYGGWLLYTAAAAGDERFVRELLAAQPLLVFGEGEYGVTDILYAAARSGCPEVFRRLFDAVLSAASCPVEGEEFRREMMCRAVHAAARGGSLDVLRDLLRGCDDAAAYRDAQGSTILHAAAAKDQVEVVKDLIASFDIVDSVDDQGNTALHIAAFRGHLRVVEALVTASSSLISATNEAGDTFLHMALTGFGTPEFRRLDRQMELIRQLVGGAIVDISSTINAQNYDGKTILHLAVVGNLHPDLVEHLMSVPSIDLNICDNDGMTPLDLLRKQPRTTSSEILIKQLILAGGFTNSRDHETRSVIASQIKMHSIVGSPGTSFKISDAEIFLNAGIDVPGISESAVSFSSIIGRVDADILRPKLKKLNSFQDAAKHIKVLLRWPHRKSKKSGSGQKDLDDDASSVDSAKTWSHEETPTPLRQRYSRISSLFNKRTYAGKTSPSEAMQKSGVVQPHSIPASTSWSSSSLVDKIEAAHLDKDQSPYVSRLIRHTPKKTGSLNSRLMNQSLRLRA